MLVKTIGLYTVLSLLAVGSSAIAASPHKPSISPFPTAVSSSYQTAQARPNAAPSRALVRQVSLDLAKRLNIEPAQVQVVETTQQTWSDRCLGLARPNERCIGTKTPGWQIQLVSPQQQWTYRTDRTGQTIRLVPLEGTSDFARGDFSIETSRLLLETVSKQTGRPLSSLQVLEVQPAVWNGCLGIYEPDTACTEIAQPGFRVLIKDGQVVWVYHLTENAEQIAQNPTASGASQSLSVSFIPINPEPTPEDELSAGVVFQSQLSGDLAGSVTRLVLTEEGTLYREQVRPIGGGKPAKEVVKQLCASEVEAFRSLLAQQRFENFNRLRYLSEAAFADYPTTQLRTPSAQVDYIDTEVSALPPALREIVEAWSAIADVEIPEPQSQL